jgi:hypothetical protein
VVGSEAAWVEAKPDEAVGAKVSCNRRQGRSQHLRLRGTNQIEGAISTYFILFIW